MGYQSLSTTVRSANGTMGLPKSRRQFATSTVGTAIRNLATQLCETLIELTQDCPGNQAAAVRDGIFEVLHRCMVTASKEETRLLDQFGPIYEKLWRKSRNNANQERTTPP